MNGMNGMNRTYYMSSRPSPIGDSRGGRGAVIDK
jgi:hypothetical protein